MPNSNNNPVFDPSAFTAPKPKPLPVILLLDVSGSMSGAKIQNLNVAVREMLDAFIDVEHGETEIHVAIITFGAEVKLHFPLQSASEITWEDLSAGGGTPLGTALKMAKAMIEDKEVLPSRAYRPAVVLVSDGRPGDNWEPPMEAFLGEGRSSKCVRIAMAIGADADEKVLGRFIEETENPLLFAENASQLHEDFKFITMSVTSRIQSHNPNLPPDPKSLDLKPSTIEHRQDPSSDLPQESTPENDEEGYW